MPTNSFFSSVQENDHGVYTCTPSYLYHGQIYNMKRTVVLNVQQKGKKNTFWIYSFSWKFVCSNKKDVKCFLLFCTDKSDEFAVITSPRMGDAFQVDLGELQSCSRYTHTCIYYHSKLLLLNLV